MSTIYVKNMVCPRCVAAVNGILEKLGIDGKVLSLGVVETASELTSDQMEAFDRQLDEAGFELLRDRQSRQMEELKNILRQLVYDEDAKLDVPLSQYVTSRIPRDFGQLSREFSKISGQTIERYFISLKIERAKELMFYDELTLSEIAYKLNYSSVAHLSSQFKRETGLSPKAFRESRRSHNGIL